MFFFRTNILLGKTFIKEEAKFVTLIYDTKLSFKNREREETVFKKALAILRVVGHTDWGADRIVLLRLYCSLIRSKLDYGGTVYGSDCHLVLNQLDPIQKSSLQLQFLI